VPTAMTNGTARGATAVQGSAPASITAARPVVATPPSAPTLPANEMAARWRDFPWETTPLGAAASWSPALQANVRFVLAAPYPMLLLQGDDLVQIYNDGYRLLMDGRHPHAFGSPVRSAWPSGWHLDAGSYELALAGTSVVTEQVHFTVTRDDEREDVPFTVTYGPALDADGRIDGVVVSAFDTTRLAAAERQAQAATRAKADFLAVMSHELRTPLNAIGGYAELLALGVRGPVTPEQRGDLERIQGSQRHLLEVINGVLHYAKIEAGVVDFAIEDIPIGELVARCEALVAKDVRRRGVTLENRARDTTLRIRADEEKTQQVLLNVLGNAIKFTEPGGTITMSCEPGEAGVHVRVSDTSHGIAASDVECIFHPFVQVDSRSTRAHEGTGLGLAVGRQLARGMGGDLSLESEVGVGSTFTLTLPCGRGACPD